MSDASERRCARLSALCERAHGSRASIPGQALVAMPLLADESVQRASVEALRASGHDVAWVLSDAPGAEDGAVLARAGVEQRTLVVADKDFGDLVFERRLPASHGG